MFDNFLKFKSVYVIGLSRRVLQIEQVKKRAYGNIVKEDMIELCSQLSKIMTNRLANFITYYFHAAHDVRLHFTAA